VSYSGVYRRWGLNNNNRYLQHHIKMRRLFPIVSVLACLAVAAAEPIKCPRAVSRLDVIKGEYYSEPGIVFRLENFSARMVPVSNRMPLCLAKITDISQGHVLVTAETLTNLFTSKASPNSKVQDLKINFEEDRVIIRGKLKKLIPLPFEIKGPVVPRGEKLTLVAEKIKAAGLPVKGLLRLVGAHLSSIMKSGTMPGIMVQGNSIIFAPRELAHVRGRFQSVRVSNTGMRVSFGAATGNTRKAHATKPQFR
jgi:hypothetical protein